MLNIFKIYMGMILYDIKIIYRYFSTVENIPEIFQKISRKFSTQYFSGKATSIVWGPTARPGKR